MVALVDSRSEFAGLARLYVAIAVIVALLVFGLTLFALLRFRRRRGAERVPSRRRDAPVLEGLYLLAIAIVVVVLVAATFSTESRVDAVAARPALRIAVTAADWRWRFDYPAQGVSSLPNSLGVTDLVVPVGETVEFDMRSLDVIHSFWIPERRFQRNAFPNRTTRFDLVFPRPEVDINARCNEFCGLGHTDMRFLVRALPRAQFDQWLAQQAGKPR